ncbi:MAG: Rossmann-like and DUF2520 domain-containing protein [Bacteroidales bacterium]
MQLSGIQRIVCIGAGNVASYLVPALYQAGYNIVQVCSRTIAKATIIAKQVNSSAVDNIAALDATADMYIVMVCDSEIENVLQQGRFGRGLVVHTSGSTAMSVFAKTTIEHYGVLYPLQTFTVQGQIDFLNTPFYIEANLLRDEKRLKSVAASLSSKVFAIDSTQRLHLHIAAVFACNFTNHMFAISQYLLQQSNLEFEALSPLIQATLSNTLSGGNPAERQTGPAVRGDDNIVQQHLSALSQNQMERDIYQVISENIQKYKQNIMLKK